jgi:hypothetical protein
MELKSFALINENPEFQLPTDDWEYIWIRDCRSLNSLNFDDQPYLEFQLNSFEKRPFKDLNKISGLDFKKNVDACLMIASHNQGQLSFKIINSSPERKFHVQVNIYIEKVFAALEVHRWIQQSVSSDYSQSSGESLGIYNSWEAALSQIPIEFKLTLELPKKTNLEYYSIQPLAKDSILRYVYFCKKDS